MSAQNTPIVLAPSEEFFEIMREAFNRNPDARVAFTTGGTSMLPMLRDRKDVVYLSKLKTRARKYDVVLFRRDSGQYVLHRVVDVEPDGTCVFCGDNQIATERSINQTQLLAIVEAFKRGGMLIDCRRSILYFLYSRVWTNTRFLRKILRGATITAKRLFQKQETDSSKK